MSWFQLLDVRRQAQEEFDWYASIPPMACPNDGTPLIPSPTPGSTGGSASDAGVTPGAGVELFCPFDGWQYPRDYVRPQRQ